MNGFWSVLNSVSRGCVFFLRGWKTGFMHYLVTVADSWVISCAVTDSVWPCPYLPSATGCRASAFFHALCSSFSCVWRESFLLSLRSLEHAKVSTWEEQSASAEVCSVQIGRGSKGEAVSLQASIKNIPRGFFFLKVKQIITKNTKSSFSSRSWFNGICCVSLGWKWINWSTCRWGKVAWNDCIPAKQNKDGFPAWKCKTGGKFMSSMISFGLFFFERKGLTWPALISQPYCEFVAVNTFTCPMFCWDYLSYKLQLEL